VADVDIVGRNPGSVVGVSGQRSPAGTLAAPDNKLFETVATGRNPRTFDSEVKILENLASGLPRDARGTINLFTERAACISCGGVVMQFRRMFPNIKLNVSAGP
jgi:hypothetical protein